MLTQHALAAASAGRAEGRKGERLCIWERQHCDVLARRGRCVRRRGVKHSPCVALRSYCALARASSIRAVAIDLRLQLIQLLHKLGRLVDLAGDVRQCIANQGSPLALPIGYICLCFSGLILELGAELLKLFHLNGQLLLRYVELLRNPCAGKGHLTVSFLSGRLDALYLTIYLFLEDLDGGVQGTELSGVAKNRA